MMEPNSLVYPGSILGVALDFKPGKNTYLQKGKILATAVGLLKVNEKDRTYDVVKRKNTMNDKDSIRFQNADPSPGQEVVGIVSQVHPGVVIIEIVEIDGRPLRYAMKGSIRFDEIRSATVRVPLIEFFRPGDTVRAQIMSIEDPHCYVLSALGNNHGVIKATSEFGFPLERVPDSAREMICSGSKAIEKRLVALS